MPARRRSRILNRIAYRSVGRCGGKVLRGGERAIFASSANQRFHHESSKAPADSKDPQGSHAM